MRYDKDLMARCGKERPFKVPEGYFENFHEQFMNNLPEGVPAPAPIAQPTVTLMMRIKPLLYMAAMFVGIIFMVQGIMYVKESYLPIDNKVAFEDIYTDEADHFMSSSLYNEYVLYSYLTTTEYD